MNQNQIPKPNPVLDAQPGFLPQKSKKFRNAAVEYLVANIALVMLAETESEPIIKKAAASHRVKLLSNYPAAEVAPILKTRDTLLKLVRMMMDVTSVELLEATVRYLEELVDGRVIVVEDMIDAELAANNLTCFDPKQ